MAKKRLKPNQAEKILADAQDENSRVASFLVAEKGIIAVPSDYWDGLTENSSPLQFEEYVDSEQGRILLNKQKVELSAVPKPAKKKPAAPASQKDVPEFLKMGDGQGDIKRRIKGGLAKTKERLRRLFFEEWPAIANTPAQLEDDKTPLLKIAYDAAIRSIRVLGLSDETALEFIEREGAHKAIAPALKMGDQVNRLRQAAEEKEAMLARAETPKVIQMAMSWKLDVPAEKISGVETCGRVHRDSEKGAVMGNS